jgi:hypothetical protein
MRRQDNLTTAATPAQSFDESSNGAGVIARPDNVSCQHADVTTLQALKSDALLGTHAKNS